LAVAALFEARRAVLHRRIRLLVAATITYNVIEAVIAISAGAVASSMALIGFGLDSVVEVGSAAVVAWQFAAADPQRRKRTALRLIAISFFALATYVTVEAVRALLGAAEPDHSPVGIGLAAVSLVVMPFLSFAQRRAGREYGSASAVADAKQTLLCTYLSAVLLVGLLANAALGWWWADPIAALVIAAVAVKEGARRDAATRAAVPPLSRNSVGAAPVAGPILLLQGEADTVVPPELTASVAASLCEHGATPEYRTYPGLVHDAWPGGPLGINDGAMPDILTWVADRFDGKPAPTTC
jgi:pimeloyl-ACP methyl ester carboxylesterase